MKLAPIVIFVYNRPWHTRQTVEALARNELAADSAVYIYADGARKGKGAAGVEVVRSYIRTISGFKEITIVERKSKWGLANNVIDAVTRLINEHGKLIVLEDDLLTSRYFLRFMNEALDKYETADRVVSIHGYVYPVRHELPETFFLRGADCWGWATWKRGWDTFDKDGKKLLTELRRRRLQKDFNFNGAYNYTAMLKKQIAGENDSWAVRWYASAFLSDKLTLYPGRTFVKNIGLDGSGTHCQPGKNFDSPFTDSYGTLKDINLIEHSGAKKVIENYFRMIRPSLLRKAGRFVNKHFSMDQ